MAAKKTPTKKQLERAAKLLLDNASARKPERTAKGFEVGQTGRRLRAIPSTTVAINSLIRRFGVNVVARSRYLATNNPYAVAAKDEFISAFVGTGIKPSSLVTDSNVKKQIMLTWKAWTDEADADGLTDLYGLQWTIAAEMFEAGECFVRLRPRFISDGLTVPLQLQLLPSEMLDTSHNEILTGGGRIECGIEFDAIGRRVAYHFWRQHPGELVQTFQPSNAGTKTRVPADEVLHLYRPIRAGQIRGVPHTLSGLATLAMIDLYDDAELERKRIAALFGAFVKRPRNEDEEEHPFTGATATPNDNNNVLSDFSLEPGAVIDLAEGQDVTFAEPADVGGTYEPFQYRNLLRAAAGFGVTYAGMTGDLRQATYGPQRAGLIVFRRKIEAMQHHVMIFQFCRPVWRRWFDDAVRTGAIANVSAAAYTDDPLSFRDVKWVTPKWEWIDPLKDRQAEKLAVDSGFKPRSDVVEAEGYDPEENDQRIKQDQERAADLGIKFIQLSSSVLVAPDDTEPDQSLIDPAGGGALGSPGDSGDFG